MPVLAGLLVFVAAQAHAAEIQIARRFLSENLAGVPREIIDSPFEVEDRGPTLRLKNLAATILIRQGGSIVGVVTASNLSGKKRQVTQLDAYAIAIKAYQSARKGCILAVYTNRYNSQGHLWNVIGMQTMRGVPFVFESANFTIDSQTGLLRSTQIAALPKFPQGPIPAIHTDDAVLSAIKAIRNRFGSFDLTLARPPSIEILTLPSVPEQPILRSCMFFDLDDRLKQARYDGQGIFAALLTFHDRRGIYYHAFLDPKSNRTIYILEQPPT